MDMWIHQQQGSALITALVAMMVLGLFGGAFVALTGSEVGIAANHRDGVAAEYLAEAGALNARVKLKYERSFRDLTNKDTATVLPTVTKNTGSTTGTYTVSVRRYAMDPLKREIVATGTVNSSKRVVRLILNLSPLEGFFTKEILPIVQYGLFSVAGMTLNNGAIVGTPSIISNIRSNGTITIGNGCSVYGTVTSGSTVTVGSKSSTGTVLQNQLTLTYPDIADPKTSALYQQYAGTVYNTSHTMSGNILLNDGIYYVNGDLTVANNTILTGSGVFYVTGNVILNNNIRNGKMLILAGGTITVSNGALMDTIMLIAKGNLSIGQNSVINGGAYSGGTIILGQGATLTYDNALMSFFANADDKGKVGSYGNY